MLSEQKKISKIFFKKKKFVILTENQVAKWGRMRKGPFFGRNDDHGARYTSRERDAFFSVCWALWRIKRGRREGSWLAFNGK